jgi:hypothetical protein
MAINKNHPFEDIDGVRCAIVETGLSESRKDFLKSILELNGYTTVVVAEAVKATPPPAGGAAPENTPEPPPATYKLAVTEPSFNTTNAIFGRLLKTREGRVVTMAYWQQKETVSRDDVPYFG